ncbi:MAG: hypothetical protein M0Q92_03955 [Methanoregula sp.]|jgi:hypothetical protein|nr:hypothetical protein [Methanoregula sp.]
MREIISIREQTGDTGFQSWYSATMGVRDVRLDPEKQDLFFTTSPKTSIARSQWSRPGRAICTVHHSQPDYAGSTS